VSADWTGNRHGESWRFVRVSWDTWEELGEYGNVTGGSVEYGYYTDLKATGSLDFDGGEPPDERDLVRVYYGFADDAGETAEAVLGTFLVECSEPTYTQGYGGDADRAEGSVDLSSTLKVLSDRLLGAPYTVPAGTQAVALAVSAVQSLGLNASCPDASSYATASDHTFKSSDSYLTAVNWLLSQAGYASCSPDAYGSVVLARYVDPAARVPVWSFAPGEASVMLDGVPVSSSWRDVPNAVRLVYESEDECLWASATNVDASHRASLPSRGGRELTDAAEVSELAGSTRAERLANLKAEARRRLVDGSADIEYAQVSHAVLPLSCGDAVSLDYAGVRWTGTLTNMQLDLAPGAAVKSKVRRSVPSTLTVEVDGGSM
jgi:hypothetical protein